MNAFLTFIPLLLMRFGLLSIIDKDSLKRAAFFPPLRGNEVIAFWIYQIMTVITILYLFFLEIKMQSVWFYLGLIIYSLGIILYTISIVNFAQPKINGVNSNGLYRMSRNPMYISYFINLFGIGLMTRSMIFVLLLLVFQISAHWIILSEERWCIERFGEGYIEYMNKVSRYI